MCLQPPQSTSCVLRIGWRVHNVHALATRPLPALWLSPDEFATGIGFAEESLFRATLQGLVLHRSLSLIPLSLQTISLSSVSSSNST